MGQPKPSTKDISHVDTARQELDAQVFAAQEEIAKIRLKICDLNSRRNELAYISRLPIETLTEIFAECMAPSEEESKQEFCESRKPVALTNILHVCRYWRTVCLSNTALWSNVTDAVPLDWLSYTIALAQSAPLSISLRRHFCPENREEAIAKLLSDPRRVRSLEVCRHPNVVTSFLQPMASSPSLSYAPLLEALKLRGIIPESSRNMVEIPEGLLSGGTPNLRVLELSNCNISWNSTLFGNLTTFKFSTTNPDGVSYESPSDLLGGLARMPNLVHLELCATQLPGMSDFTLFHENRVSLPRLKQLRCNIKRLDDGIALLKSLIIPATATIALECSVSRAESVSHFLRDLWLLAPSHPERKTASLSRGPPFQSARIRTVGFSTVMEASVDFVDPSTIRATDRLPGNTFSVRFEPRLAEPFRGLAVIQPSSIRSLNLGIDIHSFDEFQRAMSMFPLLEKIAICGGSAAHLVTYLQNDVSVDADDGEQRPEQPAGLVLPHLNSVTFAHVQFSDQNFCPNVTRRPVHISGLAIALRRRSERGKLLSKLVFRECSNISRKHHGEKLEGLVSIIIWCHRKTSRINRQCNFWGTCDWCRATAAAVASESHLSELEQ